MSHLLQQEFCKSVKEKYPDFFYNKKVLDVGSLDINGSNKGLFEDCEYIGLDIGVGPNVDIVCVAHKFFPPDETYDTIISTEMFEHDMFYEKSIVNIMRMLKPGGLFLFTCASTNRSEHGTRKSDSWTAPFLVNKGEWGDYYKNLVEDDILIIPGFKEAFPTGHFSYNEDKTDIYFCGIKYGTDPNLINMNDDILLINSYANTPEKENSLINLITEFKVLRMSILLCSHYPVRQEIQEMVDYYIFDKDNPTLYMDDYGTYKMYNNLRWTETNEFKIEINNPPIYDYAVWKTFKNAFHFIHYLEKKHIHIVDYRLLPDINGYFKEFVIPIRKYGAVINIGDEGKSCETSLFSIKTDIGIKVVDSVKSREDYYLNRFEGQRLNEIFYHYLIQNTDNISISKFYKNFNLNLYTTYAGVKIHNHLVAEHTGRLFLYLTPKFNEEFNLTVNYGGVVRDERIVGGFIVNGYKEHILEIGRYEKNKTIIVEYENNPIIKTTLNMDFGEFIKYNRIIFK